jgi:hypothetical protein
MRHADESLPGNTAGTLVNRAQKAPAVFVLLLVVSDKVPFPLIDGRAPWLRAGVHLHFQIFWNLDGDIGGVMVVEIIARRVEGSMRSQEYLWINLRLNVAQLRSRRIF